MCPWRIKLKNAYHLVTSAQKAAQMLSLLAVITPYLIGCHASHAHKNTVHSTPSNTWAETIKKDIESAYLIYMDNHPGVLDPNTPNFSRTLQEARSQALKFAHQESTRKSYNDALATFSAVLPIDKYTLGFDSFNFECGE